MEGCPRRAPTSARFSEAQVRLLPSRILNSEAPVDAFDAMGSAARIAHSLRDVLSVAIPVATRGQGAGLSADLAILGCRAVRATVSTKWGHACDASPSYADGEVWSTILDPTSIQARRIERTSRLITARPLRR